VATTHSSWRRVACSGALLLLACGPRVDLSALANASHPPPAAELTGVVFEGYSAGAREIEVRAARARVEPAERLVHLDRVQIGFRDAKRGQVRIDAERAVLRLDNDDFILHDQVEGSTASGERFTTAEVRYEQAAERLWTDRPVRLERDNLLVEGEGMEIDLSTRRIRLTGSVQARIKSK
jgi:LPS export ABC transporter protein LptC